MNKNKAHCTYALLVAIAAASATTFAASVGDTVVWRNSGTAGSGVSHAYGSYRHDFCLPSIDGLPKGSRVEVTNISLGSRNTECKIGGGTNADTEYLRIIANGTFYDARLNDSGTFDGKTISAHGTYVPRLSYSYEGVAVTVGETNKLEFIYYDYDDGKYWYINQPGFKVVKTSDTTSAVTIGNSDGWYPVYEITATVVSLGADPDTAATVSGDASLSALAWSSPRTTDGTQWAVITVTDNATLNLDASTDFKLLTIKVAGNKTLTLTGVNALTATTIDISGKGTVKAASSALSGAVTGCGGLAYVGGLPGGVTFAYDWCGMLTLEKMDIKGPDFNDYGNVASTIALSGITGWVNTGTEYAVPIRLDDGNYVFALKLTDGNSPQDGNNNQNRCSIFRKVSGTGCIVDGIKANSKSAWPVIKIYDASDFAGNINIEQANIIVCNDTTTYGDTLFDMLYHKSGALRIDGSLRPTLATGKTWSFNAYTDETDFDELVLFTAADAGLLSGGELAVNVNGAPLDTAKYIIKYKKGQVVARRRFGFRLGLR